MKAQLRLPASQAGSPSNSRPASVVTLSIAAAGERASFIRLPV